MRLGITLVRRAGVPHFEVLLSPEMPLTEQLDLYKKGVSDRETYLSKDIEEIQVWSSTSGRIKRHRFRAEGSGTNLGAIIQKDQPSPGVGDSLKSEPVTDDEPEKPENEKSESVSADAPQGMESVLATPKKKSK